MDPNSGFCSETKIYHSLRPQVPLPPETTPLSITDYAFSLLRQASTTISGAKFIDVTTHECIPSSELEIRTKTLAFSLQHHVGLCKGDCAFVLSPNSVHIPILYLSLLSLGVIVSPSNPASSKTEISRQIQICKPVIAFVTSDTAHKVASLRYRTIFLDSPEFESMTKSRTETSPQKIEVFPYDVAAIMFSSGTTGKTKGVILTHRNFMAMLAGVHAIRPIRSSTAVMLCTVPYFHVYGFTNCVRAASMGEILVSMKRFDLRLMMKAIEEFRITHVALAPPVIVALVNSGDLVNNYDLSSLEAVHSGGAPLSEAVIERFKSKFPNVSLGQVSVP
ncbi:unnamed protein product [Ilex paraguariensis]|uniref:AMP-dependent synthetase/ligase domain-containing protein n=1 Tax=Ilex paraguariensis TaxID=185542 RepID=A0ABC8SF25_9AQUA